MSTRTKKPKEDPRIPKSFRKGERGSVVTVGALINELQQLPPELPVNGDFGPGVAVTVTNWNDEQLVVVIESAEVDDDIDEDDE